MMFVRSCQEKDQPRERRYEQIRRRAKMFYIPRPDDLTDEFLDHLEAHYLNGDNSDETMRALCIEAGLTKEPA
ncbi:unnamed protein product [marine sediment metagenome]|uniref:Uncharacterized protein n=1 Tax=marine sediment metagenome TaxID=412755 RepID=X0ULT6_9ZZZZ